MIRVIAHALNVVPSGVSPMHPKFSSHSTIHRRSVLLSAAYGSLVMAGVANGQEQATSE